MRSTGAEASGRIGRHGELATCLGSLSALLVLAQVLLAPGVLVAAALLTGIGWLARWRLWWLIVPAAAGLWLLARSGAAIGALRLATAELAVARHPALLARPGALSAAVRWLRPQVPAALLAGPAESAVALAVLIRGPQRWRPGLVAAVRRRRASAALSAGRTVTADGCAVGLCAATGALISVTWADAERGLMVSGVEASDVQTAALAVVCAAVRLHKTVFVADACGGELVAQTVALAARLGRPVRDLAGVGGGSAEAGSAAAGSAAAGSASGADTSAVGRAVRDKAVVVAGGGAGPRLLAAAVGVLGAIRDHGLRGDCLVCVAGSDRMPAGELADLLRLASATGTAVVLTEMRTDLLRPDGGAWPDARARPGPVSILTASSESARRVLVTATPVAVRRAAIR